MLSATSGVYIAVDHLSAPCHWRGVWLETVLRLAVQEDLKALERLFEEFSGWRRERSASILKAVTNPSTELLVAEHNHHIVGFLHQVFFEDPLHAGTNSFIIDFFVEAEFRKKGIGTSLLKQSMENAKRRQVKEVHVTTREDNKKAIQFYEKLGFERAGVLFEFNP
jgi:ribosomal protein S18 acetylase RimI-like enzyme